jgi:hypothetical protein
VNDRAARRRRVGSHPGRGGCPCRGEHREYRHGTRRREYGSHCRLQHVFHDHPRASDGRRKFSREQDPSLHRQDRRGRHALRQNHRPGAPHPEFRWLDHAERSSSDRARLGHPEHPSSDRARLRHPEHPSSAHAELHHLEHPEREGHRRPERRDVPQALRYGVEAVPPVSSRHRRH